MAKLLFIQKFIMVGLLFGRPFTIGQAANGDNCPLPDPDYEAENNLLYRKGFYILDNVGHQPFPFGSFEILLDADHRGHLQSHARRADQAPMTKDALLLDWKDRTGYFVQGKQWTQLSLDGAKKLWGEPRKYVL